MYTLTLHIHQQDKHGTISYDGYDVAEMKAEINHAIITMMKLNHATNGEVFVEMDIEHNGEYYDHDEQIVLVDLKNNSVKYDI